jgi:hypothetical protein
LSLRVSVGGVAGKGVLEILPQQGALMAVPSVHVATSEESNDFKHKASGAVPDRAVGKGKGKEEGDDEEEDEAQAAGIVLTKKVKLPCLELYRWGIIDCAVCAQ